MKLTTKESAVMYELDQWEQSLDISRRTRLDSTDSEDDSQQVGYYGGSNPAFNPHYQQDLEMSSFPNAPPSYEEVISSRN